MRAFSKMYLLGKGFKTIENEYGQIVPYGDSDSKITNLKVWAYNFLYLVDDNLRDVYLLVLWDKKTDYPWMGEEEEYTLYFCDELSSDARYCYIDNENVSFHFLNVSQYNDVVGKNFRGIESINFVTENQAKNGEYY